MSVPLRSRWCAHCSPPPLLSEHALLSVLSSTLDVRRCGSRWCGGPYFACRRDIKLVHELYFPLQPSKDVAFEIGRIFMGLKDFSSAAELFRCEEELYANVMLLRLTQRLGVLPSSCGSCSTNTSETNLRRHGLARVETPPPCTSSTDHPPAISSHDKEAAPCTSSAFCLMVSGDLDLGEMFSSPFLTLPAGPCCCWSFFGRQRFAAILRRAPRELVQHGGLLLLPQPP